MFHGQQENTEEDNSPIIQEFKGKPTLVLNPKSNYPFSFGVMKAKLILQNLETIQKFVESEGEAI